MSNPHFFVYSMHRTLCEAQDALEEYFASGEVCEGEHPYVKQLGNRFAVMFPG